MCELSKKVLRVFSPALQKNFCLCLFPDSLPSFKRPLNVLQPLFLFALYTLKEDNAVAGKGNRNGLFKAVHGYFFGPDRFLFKVSLSSEHFFVGVENHLITSAFGNADTIFLCVVLINRQIEII